MKTHWQKQTDIINPHPNSPKFNTKAGAERTKSQRVAIQYGNEEMEEWILPIDRSKRRACNRFLLVS